MKVPNYYQQLSGLRRGKNPTSEQAYTTYKRYKSNAQLLERRMQCSMFYWCITLLFLCWSTHIWINQQLGLPKHALANFLFFLDSTQERAVDDKLSKQSKNVSAQTGLLLSETSVERRAIVYYKPSTVTLTQTTKKRLAASPKREKKLTIQIWTNLENSTENKAKLDKES